MRFREHYGIAKDIAGKETHTYNPLVAMQTKTPPEEEQRRDT